MYVLGYYFHKVCLLYDCKIKRWYECKKTENLSKKNTGWNQQTKQIYIIDPSD